VAAVRSTKNAGKLVHPHRWHGVDVGVLFWWVLGEGSLGKQNLPTKKHRNYIKAKKKHVRRCRRFSLLFKKKMKENSTIVGGFNPVEKYARQNGNLPQFSG